MHNIKCTLSNLRSIVGKDESRPVLGYVRYEPERGELVVTNGRIAAFYSVEPDDDDVAATLPLAAFNTTGILRSPKDQPFLRVDVRENEIRTWVPTYETLCEGGLSERITRPYDDENYPDAYHVLDVAREQIDKSNGLKEIGISPEKLLQLVKATPIKSMGFCSFRFLFASPNNSVLVYPTGRFDEDERPVVYFLLMPVLLEAYANKMHLNGHRKPRRVEVPQ